MERDDLERWLCGPDVPLTPPCVLATALGLHAGVLADTTLLRTARRVRSLRLTLAVLRDVFVEDADVAAWLATEHAALGCVAPVDAIRAGREDEVADLAVSVWNALACVGSAVGSESFVVIPTHAGACVGMTTNDSDPLDRVGGNAILSGASSERIRSAGRDGPIRR